MKHKLTSANINFCFVDDQFFTPSNAGPSSKLGLYSVHITLQDYAVSAISPSTTNIECSVESSECDDQINIIAKDLRLYSTGGQCFQNISINETEIGVINTFNCDDNTNFIQNLNFFKSQTNHIILTFTNSHQQPGGYFWIQLVSGNVVFTVSVSTLASLTNNDVYHDNHDDWQPVFHTSMQRCMYLYLSYKTFTALKDLFFHSSKVSFSLYSMLMNDKIVMFSFLNKKKKHGNFFQKIINCNLSIKR